MTYLAFLAIFLVMPTIVMAIGLWYLGRNDLRRIVRPVVYVSILALVYTSPWDNYLVYRGVWMYGAERVIATIGYVPVEEYSFMAIQPWFTGLVLTTMTVVVRRRGELARRAHSGLVARFVVGSLLVAAAVAGAGLLAAGHDRQLYLGLILAWACPVLLALWLIGGRLISNEARSVVAALSISTAYLWVADWFALKKGIWTISERFTTGLGVSGLPLEEAVFFFVTNLLVVFGVTMLRK